MPVLPEENTPRLNRRCFLGSLGATLAAPALHAETAIRFPNIYGETVLDRPASRVVSIGYTTQDPLLALGVVPVGIRYWFGDTPYGVWPWAQAQLGNEKPVLMSGEVSMETVAGLAPDLIVAVGSGISQPEYELLSRIAPVLLQSPEYSTFGSPWQETTRLVGQATGRPARAEELIAELDDHFADTRQRHRNWAGKTAVAAWQNGGETGAFIQDDNRAQFLSELGFIPTRSLREMEAPNGFYATFSPEDLSPLDADVLLWISGFDSADDIANLPMRRTLAAHRQGREIFAGPLIAGALSFGSILSLPFALNALEQDLVAAIDGDPATPVQSANMAALAP